MATSKIAIFGVGGNIGKGLIPLLVNEYDKFTVMAQMDETRSFLNRDDVIFRGNYYLERDAVMEAMKGCKKVMLALPRALTRLELIGYAKFIGECAVSARVPTLIRLAVADYETFPASNEDVKNFQLLDEYLDTLAIEVITIQSGTMVSGMWSPPKIKRRKQQKKSAKEMSSSKSPKKADDDFIGLSFTFDTTTSEEASPDVAGSQPATSPSPLKDSLWQLVYKGSRSPARKSGKN